MKTSEAWPGDSWLESQFTCFDEDKPSRESGSRWDTYIGNVRQVEAGPEGGLSSWSVTATLPSPRFSGSTSSKEAGRRVVEYYEHMLRFHG